MATRLQVCGFGSMILLFAGCYREHTADEDDTPEDVQSDAGAATANDGGAGATGAPRDASTCTGQDALSQLVCQLGSQGMARTDAGASQPGLQDLLNGLAGLTGATGANGQVDIQSLLDGLLGGAGGLGGATGLGGAAGLGGTRRDAGRPQSPRGMDTPSAHDAGISTPATPSASDAGADNGSVPDAGDASLPADAATTP